MRPVISVIIPTLNEENYLPSLLNDLKKQTKKDFEVIIVDAISEDQTKTKAMAYRNDFDFHFIESPERGLSFQRNLGAEKSKGTYLFFLDADTRIDSDVIEKADKHITTEGHALYLPVILSSNQKKRYRFLVKFVVVLVRSFHAMRKPFSLGPIILIKKDLFDDIGGFNLKTAIAEDHNLIIKAHKHGHKAHFVTDMRCHFSMRRFEQEGILNVMWKYTFFSIETFFLGGVTRKSPNYKMGGHNYKKAQVTE
jgi:glycosyltransferase involved in cell wall biosynthesis